MLFNVAFALLLALLCVGCATNSDLAKLRADVDAKVSSLTHLEGDSKALEQKWTALTDEVVVQTGTLKKALDDVKKIRASSNERAQDVAQSVKDIQQQQAKLEALVLSLRGAMLRTYQLQTETLQKLAAEMDQDNVSGKEKRPERRAPGELPP